ncbi:MAG: hypothetical protein HY851_10775 [candidate division Zixibacteria bacterium]|nr:hypothetical protein [candidate division Zixibacteria bacterium]
MLTPICPARRPIRATISLVLTSAPTRAAGRRPCSPCGSEPTRNLPAPFGVLTGVTSPCYITRNLLPK